MKSKFIIFILFPFFFSLSQAAAITIAIAPICPYSCPHQPDSPGYLSHILKKSLAPDKVSFISIPEGRLKKGLLAGTYDFVVIPSFEIIRESDLFVSSPPLGIHFLGKAALKPELVALPMREVKNKVLSIVKEKALFQYLEKKHKKYPSWGTNKVSYISGDEISRRMVKMLLLKRTDLIISDYNALSYEILKQKVTNSVYLRPSSLSGFSPLVLVSKNGKNQQVYDRIAKWIHRSRKEGSLKKLLRLYNLDDWDIYNTRL